MPKRTPEEIIQMLSKKIVTLKTALKNCTIVSSVLHSQCIICKAPSIATEQVHPNGETTITYIVEKHAENCELEKLLNL